MIERVLYPLPEVPLVALGAMTFDCEAFAHIGRSGSQFAWLCQFIPPRHAAPSHDVVRNVVLALRSVPLLEIMELWVDDLDAKHIAIDGNSRQLAGG